MPEFNILKLLPHKYLYSGQLAMCVALEANYDDTA